ncbi:MAG: hypothetical protein M1839_003060 [Geoglossum umbratile]|nr:MAG: hypothetical protein M1839_003060 [Geoglossum umbratile]
MTSQRRFFILNETIPASETASMMCRVVSDKLFPQHKYAPFPALSSDEPCHNTNMIVPGITPLPQISFERREFIQRVKEMELSTALASFFGVDLKRGKEDTVELCAAVVKRYSLEQPELYFKKLMENELYARDVRKMLESSSSSKAYLVTGFLTATGAVWKITTGHSRITGFKAAAPTPAFIGLPVPGIAPSMDPSWTTIDTIAREMCVLDEEIFAVAYSEIRFSYTFDKSAPRFAKATPTVGPPKRTKARHLAMGTTSDTVIDVSSDEDDEPVNRERATKLMVVQEISELASSKDSFLLE